MESFRNLRLAKWLDSATAYAPRGSGPSPHRSSVTDLPRRDAVGSPVIHVIGSLDRGGTEIRLLETFETLAQVGRLPPTHLVLLSGRTGPLAERAEAVGIELHPMPLNARFPSRFVSLVRGRRAGTVHSHVHLFSGVLTTLARLGGSERRIAHFRSTGDGKATTSSRRARDAVLRTLIRQSATDVLAGTSAVMDAVWGPGWETDRRFAVVPQGVDVAAAVSALEARAPVALRRVVQIGRLDEDKNQTLSIRVFAELARAGLADELVLAGRPTGTYERTLQNLAESEGVANCVRFVGEVADVQAAIADATIMLHPTRREGWPGVVVEAAVSGLPIVATAIPPIVEVAASLGCVKLVSIDAELCTWTNTAMQCLASSPDRATRLGIARGHIGGEFDRSGAALLVSRHWHVP